LCGAAQAEVTASAPDALVIQIKAEIPLDRAASWARLLNVGSWWSDAHTYSGKAASMSIDAVAGGCWCELWAGGEVEHGRVVYLAPQEALRLSSALGPLQEMGVTGALTFTLSDGSAPGSTVVTLDMKVSGSSLSGLDKIGPAVDQVLSEQVTRLAKGE
jgi:uncharacterized protein YndB with AHSA1/START domain